MYFFLARLKGKLMWLYIKVLLLAMGSSSHLRGPSQKTGNRIQWWTWSRAWWGRQYHRLNNSSPKDTYMPIPGACDCAFVWQKSPL